MSPASRHTSIRSIRRSVRRSALKEYVGGSLWVLPSVAALLPLAVGYGISQIEVPPGSPLNWLAFQGTADDARALLITVSSTVVTVIALVLGLTVVALQLSSTQFSPRLLRNFLRDRGTQVALSTFIATFVYSAAGLFTVGLEAGIRTEVYPRLAVSGAIALLFLSLAMVVYFADHLAHSIQIDAINRRVGRNTRRAIAPDDTSNVSEVAPDVPEWAVPLLARCFGCSRRWQRCCQPVRLAWRFWTGQLLRRLTTLSVQYRVRPACSEFGRPLRPSESRSTPRPWQRSRRHRANPNGRVVT
jgi:uncharacterized membrane protein